MSLQKAREVLRIEAEAINHLAKNLNKDFLKALNLILKCKGRVIVTGMGKTGIIGHKIAATLSSTGTPSLWMHSAEALHGDLGQVTSDDVVIIISNSGQTEETTRLLPLLHKIGSKLIGMTGNPKSVLATRAHAFLNVNVKREGCPLGLAPMASTTATLAMGDALAACLIVRRKFKKEDFARFHPAGALGRQLLLKVEDIMRKGTHFPRIRAGTSVKNVLLAITKARCGSACVVDAKGKLLGIFTDGDLRRHIDQGPRLFTQNIKAVMTAKPTAIQHDSLAVEAFELLKQKKIDEMPVVDATNKVVGLLDIQDLLNAGLF